MIPAWIALVDGLLAVAFAAVGIGGAHFRFFAPFTGFQFFVVGFLLAILATFFGIIGYFVTRKPPRRRLRPRAVIGLVLGLIVGVPIVVKIVSTSKYPAINDITTDVNNPPEFVQAPQLPANRGRDMKYDKAKYAVEQEKGYGDVKPLKMAAAPDQVFQKVEALASRMPHWRVTYTDPKTHDLEGVATSWLFHFHDDFVIQVRPDAGGGSLVEMRSKSRSGIGDLGVNYNRIENFFSRLKAVPPSASGKSQPAAP